MCHPEFGSIGNYIRQNADGEGGDKPHGALHIHKAVPKHTQNIAKGGAYSAAKDKAMLFEGCFFCHPNADWNKQKAQNKATGYSENRTYIPTSLKTVVITGGTSIASSAFNNCNSIESITLPKSVTSIGNSAFKGCTKLNTVNYVGTEAEWQAISGLDQLPQNVQIIYNYKG